MFFTFNDQCQIFTSKQHYRKKRKYRPCSLLNSRKRHVSQFFSRERLPWGLYTNPWSVHQVTSPLTVKNRVVFGVSEIILLRSWQINGYFWILIRVFTGTPEIETSSAWWILKSYESRQVGSLLFLPQKQLSPHGPLRFVISHSWFRSGLYAPEKWGAWGRGSFDLVVRVCIRCLFIAWYSLCSRRSLTSVSNVCEAAQVSIFWELGTQRTQRITARAFRISFLLDWQIDNGILNRLMMARTQIWVHR